MTLFRFLLCCAWAFVASLGWGPAGAQQIDPAPATLIADRIDFEGGSQVVEATGSVEVFYQSHRLRAQSVRYDGVSDTLVVQGPLSLTEANGRTVFFAEFGELSADLQTGVLQSARLVLDRELQIAATEINRSGGRYTQLYQTVASSCEICAENPTPIWEIRARRIVHDQLERQLYFEHAQFRALGVPIAYLPRLRMPDPTVERATGFLTPTITSSNLIGTGIRMPYFIVLGDHADLTLTPFLTLNETQTLGARYRQAFRNGFIEVNGALSWDDLTDDTQRGYLFANGSFDLPRDFQLSFALQSVSDRDYLLTYGFPGGDRLKSNLIFSRARRDEYIEGGLTYFSSLRDADDNRTLPNRALDAEYTRRYTPRGIGGIASLSFSTHTHYRLDSSDMTGRDVSRITANADWRRDWVLPAGVLLAVETEVYADYYNIQQDSSFPGTETRFAPFAAVELRWPWAMTSARGVTHLVEPTVQLAWSDDGNALIPNEDSAVVEFDEANLFSLNRFPGNDARENGRRLNIGVTYTRTDPLGWSLGVTVGRIYRYDGFVPFTQGSGLDGRQSDWLLATYLGLGQNLSVMNRTLFDDDLEFTSNELALAWAGEAHNVSSSFIWLRADPAEGRPRDMAELTMDVSYDFDNAWAAQADWRYDFVANESTRANLALTYATECVDVEFSLSRRFTSSATLEPATEFGLSVALNGFGATRNGRRYDRSCRR
ncbi:LPS-assembly protein LptD [Rhodophyticola sp. CCM32]|uniref:LPS-assembly protein LptD n=1 Tax=Rhodophyticola sp. CCM32 TaxID=2916397 RepID=UPI00107EF314|nr:LPS assembly protein LptD [Rhodophyticola sp. CCM32]QBX99976.1 LPS-assembly protein LptD [Rhodophyticola sp. CCM32]